MCFDGVVGEELFRIKSVTMAKIQQEEEELLEDGEETENPISNETDQTEGNPTKKRRTEPKGNNEDRYATTSLLESRKLNFTT